MIFLGIVPLLGLALADAAPSDPAERVFEKALRRVVPVTEYVRISPVPGGALTSPLTLDKPDLRRLTVWFNRDSLTADDGVQFVRITVTILEKDGTLRDKITERAFTFARGGGPEADEARMREYSRVIHPLGFASRRKIDSVEIDLEDIPDWGRIDVRVEPDEDFAAYAQHRGNRVAWHYRARGRRVDGAFFLGIPKVLYDTHDRGGLNYGRTSAMYRLFWLEENSGARFPIGLGVGVFGVNTPIDVSSRGGGYAMSALLDVFELARRSGIRLTSKVNAGIEVVPFFPLEEAPRLLVAIRVGVSP
jgi:hypothetical protein